MSSKLSILALCGILTLFACSNNQEKLEQKNEWEFNKEISLDDISPIGIIYEDSVFWLSDAEHNKIVKVSLKGEILEEFKGFQRPMHISKSGAKIYVPEFLTDSIKIIHNDEVETFELLESPDAPASIDVEENLIAIADFYNHRIILQEDEKTTIIGKKGHNKGKLFYPTDVEIENNLIYVADAYNNRIQVFDKQSNSLQIIGSMDNINVATGIAVADKNIFATDFYGNRILVYNLEGKLLQELKEHLNKPTDVFISNNMMYVSNFEGQSISVFSYNAK